MRTRVSPWLVGGIGVIVGAAFARLYDPDRGRARRARLRSHTVGVVRRTGRHAAGSVARRFRYTRGRAHGAIHHATHLRGHAPDDDVTLTQKVRSEVLGAARFRRFGITIDAIDGRVTLRGEVPRHADIREVEHAVSQVAGVRSITNLLHTPGTIAPNKRDALRVQAGVIRV